MKNGFRRTPKNYEGTGLTTRRLGDLLPLALSQISSTYQVQPVVILQAWPEVIGERLSRMSSAVSFCNGVLIVKVKNSLCFELLKRDSLKIYLAMVQKFPNAGIKKINFHMA